MPYYNGDLGPSDGYERFDGYRFQESKLPKILTIILIAVAAFLVVGTIIAFASKKALPGQKYRPADPSPEKVVTKSQKSSSKLTTTSLGQLRVATKPETDGSNAVLVVSPWFSYLDGDVQLFEEISQKDVQLKSIISGYFSSKSKSELLSSGEKKVKEEIKEQINAHLVLGKIEALYFEDYLFFDEKL